MGREEKGKEMEGISVESFSFDSRFATPTTRSLVGECVSAFIRVPGQLLSKIRSLKHFLEGSFKLLL